MREDPFGRDRSGSPTARTPRTARVRDRAPASGQTSPKPPRPAATGRPASIGKRVGAYILDSLAVGVTLAFVGMRAGIVPVAAEAMTRTQAYAAGAIASLAILVYFVGFEAAFGQTLAKRLLRIRVVMPDGSNPTVRAAFIRRVSFVASMLIPLVGPLLSFAVPLAALITAIQDEPTMRGFHDRWADTSVIETAPV